MVDAQTETEDLAQEKAEVTEILYKHNLELAIKNKTLSLLRQIYQASILTIEPSALAEKIVTIVRTTLECEFVGIFMLEPETGALVPLRADQSERLAAATAAASCPLAVEPIPKAESTPFFKPLFSGNENHSENLSDVWDSAIACLALDTLKQQGHIATISAYPFILEGKMTGVLLMGINRAYDQLNEYERESIASLSEVTAIALDRARLYEELKKANEQLSEFMSLATHEIRNPATFIKGFAAGALEGDLGELAPAVKDGMQKMYVRANDIIHLGNQYLNKSKLELNKITYEFAPLDLGKLVEDLVHEFEPAAAQQGISITAAIDTNQTYTTQADSGKLKEVIGNLIDNAVKYTKQGSVTVSLAKGEGTVTVKIADTGVGIPTETIPQLFKKFSRADAEKANILGSGLGLYLAKIFIDAHHGRIWVESVGEGKGSTFYIELPAA